MTNGLGGGQGVLHLLADHLGSTQSALEGGGKAVGLFEYGPYGETTAAVEAPYHYIGHPWDEAQGVYQTPARAYDPTLGRFLSVDPQRQDASRYVYAGNNPVGFLDPTGGVAFPFYVFTGFEKGPVGTDIRSFKADAISSVFGRHIEGTGQNAMSAAMFNDRGELLSVAESHPQLFVRKSGVDYGKMYLFIGGDTTVDEMGRLREGMGALERQKPGFARDVTIMNFSGNMETGEKIAKLFVEAAGRDPLLLHAGLEIVHMGTGYERASSFTSDRGNYSLWEFVAHVYKLESAQKQRRLEAEKQRRRDREYQQVWDEFVNWDPGGQGGSGAGAGPRFITLHSGRPQGRTGSELPLPSQPRIPNLEPYDGE